MIAIPTVFTLVIVPPRVRFKDPEIEESIGVTNANLNVISLRQKFPKVTVSVAKGVTDNVSLFNPLQKFWI
jgi:hypothetical protein